MILLNLLLLKIFIPFFKNYPKFNIFSLLIITLSAIEARIGISLMTLISRRKKKKKIKKLKLLKK